MAKSEISPEMFVKIWQTSDTLAEAAERMNMKEASVAARARYFKGKGVPLKQLTKPYVNDWAELAELAQQLEGGDGED